MIPRRLRTLGISPELIIAFLQGWKHLYRVIDDVPDDAHVIRVEWNEPTQTILLVVESESFDMVPAGAEIPGWFPRLERRSQSLEPSIN